MASDLSGPLLGLLVTRHAQGDDILTGGVAPEGILLGLAIPHLLLGQVIRVVTLDIVSCDVPGQVVRSLIPGPFDLLQAGLAERLLQVVF